MEADYRQLYTQRLEVFRLESAKYNGIEEVEEIEEARKENKIRKQM